MSTATLASWLLTYLVHSTILLGAAWLVARTLGDRRFAFQEALLRTALVGGFLTATLQVGLGLEPLGGSLALDRLSPTVPVESTGELPALVAAAGHSNTMPSDSEHGRAGHLLPSVISITWGVGALSALLGLGRSILDLRRLLESRRIRPAGRLVERLASALGLRRPVRLSTTKAIAVPFATGIRKPEICCPERVGDLAPEHQTGLFAHELAHLARRDPLWQLVYRVGGAVLFLQPLNRLVRRRLEEIAEHLTDERAVACTGNRLGLARCLVVIAHWGQSDSPGVPATALAAGPRLDRRVRHLISGTISRGGGSPWASVLLVVLSAASVFLLPSVACRDARAAASWDGGEGTSAETPPAAIEREEMPVPPAAPRPPTPSDEIASTPLAAPQSAPDPAAIREPLDAPPLPATPAPAVEPMSAGTPEPESAPAPPEAPEPPAEPAPQTSPSAPEPPQRYGRPASVEPAEREREEVRRRGREEQRERPEAERERMARERSQRKEPDRR